LRSSFYHDKVYPKILKYFAVELDATEQFFYEHDIVTFAPAANGATIGELLWNRQHGDDDLGITCLVAHGEPAGGGEFCHSAHGRAHRVRSGDILVVNPAETHGTAEFELTQGREIRRMVAFFIKTAIVRAAGAAWAHARENNLPVPGACKKRRRGPRPSRRGGRGGGAEEAQ